MIMDIGIVKLINKKDCILKSFKLDAEQLC
jgi:hypothetical protein